MTDHSRRASGLQGFNGMIAVAAAVACCLVACQRSSLAERATAAPLTATKADVPGSPSNSPPPAQVSEPPAAPASSSPPASAAVPAAPAAETPPAKATQAAPTQVDLRPRLLELGLKPRAQGARGTCSIFTTCEAIEFAVAVHKKAAVRLSPEYLNWAASQAAGRPSDGNFFHNALKGFDQLGLCTESSMPYQPGFEATRAPTDAARAEAARLRDESKESIAVRWIVPWKPDRFGLSEEQFAEVKGVLARGFPVAAGSGHSRLLVGYRDDPKLPGGGAFLTEDSALARFDEVTYEFVRNQVADVFWVEAVDRKPDTGG